VLTKNDQHRERDLARATYLHLPSGAKLWIARKDFEDADPQLLGRALARRCTKCTATYWKIYEDVELGISRREREGNDSSDREERLS